jgi:cell wall-associated NlpC family hydrolase
MRAPARSARLGLVAAVLTSLLVAALAPTAAADPSYPSQKQVDDAKHKVATTAATVGRIEAQLAAADARLADLGVEVGKAVEAYDGARYRLDQATKDAQRAADSYRESQGQVATAEDALGQFAAAVYRSGGDLAQVGSLLDAEGPQQLADRMSMLQRVGDQQQQVVEQLRVARAVSAVMRQKADQARSRQEAALAQVATAKAAAEQRLADQKAAVAAISTQREQLIVQLAAARRTSVALEQARQKGLAAEKARREAEARRKAEAARKAAEARRAAQAAQQAGRGSGAGSTPVLPGGSSHGTTAGAQRAIDYARAQIGKPYVWAAAGPDSFDCSGLTMRAWQAGGVSLGHFTGAQWDQTRHVALSDLRPGDLVFFASSKTDPSTIYHVGLYIGGGQMIEAPYTGENVRIASIDRPSLFGAGRP